MSAKRRKAPPPKPWWEIHAGKIILAAATVAALSALWNFSEPFRLSHLPSASQDEVKAVADKHLMDGKTLADQLEKLDMRQMQSIQRGQNVANQLRTLRMADIRAEIVRLQNAKDDASRTLLARDQQELDALIQEQNSAPMP